MRSRLMMVFAALLLASCSSTMSAIGLPSGRNADVVVSDNGSRGRHLKVPPGHYPRAGQCRIWYEGRPPGHQPKAASCASLVGHVPAGAFLLYGSTAYDTKYDWRGLEKRKPGSVPQPVLQVMVSVRN